MAMPKRKRAGTRTGQTGEQRAWELPLGVKLRQTLRGHESWIGRIAWSPDGRIIASPSDDKTIRLWDVEAGAVVRTLEGHSAGVNCVAWSPDGRLLASVGDDHTARLWEGESGRLVRTLKGRTGGVVAIAWSPDGRRLASGGDDRTIRLWHPKSGRTAHVLEGHTDAVTSVAWSSDGRMLASGSADRVAKLWNAETGQLVHTFRGHTSWLLGLAWLSHERAPLLITASGDETIRLWESATGKPTRIIEGHTSFVKCVAMTSDQQLMASKGNDDTVRLWRSDTWGQGAVISEQSSIYWPPGLAFHPSLPLLASVGSDPDTPDEERDRLIHIWELDLAILLSKTPKTKVTPAAVYHTTAKIVLVGDSGVGKTGLGWRLAHGEFKEHASTHGQQFWVLNELSTRRADGTECEAILWDLAGQPDYRLTHALFLDDADLALVLFDPTDSRDPLHGVEFWLKQLKAGQTSRTSGQQTQSADRQDACPTMLIGARADRGEARLTQSELDAFCHQRGISGGYLATSAKESIGLEELLRRMKEGIPWDQKTTTVTTVTFKRIKDYALKLKENRRRKNVIVSPQDLRKRLEKTNKTWKFTDAEMMTAVGHLANYGYMRVLRTSKGEECILLVPELLNNLAASFVLEARRNLKGLGSLEEKRLLAGEYPFRELEKLALEERDVLLDSAALLFLEHNICFRETDPLGGQSYLVFPELINLKKPVLDDEQPTEDGVAYTVSGAVENVYASLVVLLGYTQTFTRTDQWRSQARYEMGNGLICGFRQDAERDGELDLVLYFGTNVGRPVRTLFQGLFESFLARRNLSVFRYEPVVCSNGHALNRAVVRDATPQGQYLRLLFGVW